MSDNKIYLFRFCVKWFLLMIATGEDKPGTLHDIMGLVPRAKLDRGPPTIDQRGHYERFAAIPAQYPLDQLP